MPPELVLALGLFFISMGAFSLRVKKKIKERDHNQSVWSGETEHLEVAHIDHSRSNPRYNNESNGRLLAVQEHYMDHYNRHGRNGINSHQNIWALKTIWNRLSPEEKRGLPSPGTLE